MLDIAVCDDEITFFNYRLRPVIRKVLLETNTDAKIRYFSDGNKLIERFNRREPSDIVFLDIDMPSVSGKTKKKKLREIDSAFFLAFVTSYPDEVFSTIPYNIRSFISKSQSDEEIASEIKRIIFEYRKSRPEYAWLSVYKNNKRVNVKIVLDNIMYFYCVNREVYVKTSFEDLKLADSKYTDIVHKFSEKGFFEICRGYIVNIRRIQVVRNSDIELDGGEILPLSRGKSRELMSEISMLIVAGSE